MKAIYKGKLYQMGDNMQHVALIDTVEATGTGVTVYVPWSDPELIIDPTDDQINNMDEPSDESPF
jgi:hypothetical protein